MLFTLSWPGRERNSRSGRRLKPAARRRTSMLRLEPLEVRNVLSTLTLTRLVQVSSTYPPILANPSAPPNGTVFLNSEVEPQIAVDPTDPRHAVAVWQQDRYRSGGGARALVASVSHDANNPDGAHWSAPAAIPGFDATSPNSPFGRYTDPWVAIAPNGDVYATALALTTIGPFPFHTAVQVVKSRDGSTWSTPTTLIDNQAPPGTDPIDLANDKEMVIADPNDSSGKTVYVVWDRLDHPSASQDFEAFHALAFREDALFSRTTDGGAHWSTPQNLTNFQANVSAFGNEIVVQPKAFGGAVVDVFTHENGSGNQPPQAGQDVLGVLRSTDQGATWSDVITGPAIEAIPVTDPNTGAAVRSGEPLISAAVDPNTGNIFVVWADGRFSGFAHNDVALSMSTDGGRTWSAPIKINQTPTNIPAGNQQAFTPAVAVSSDGTVAVTYYDFRNNTGGPGLPTDYWLVHASSNFTNPGSWATDEKRVTDTSFNMENAARTSRGYFLGDYQGLAAAGTSFYILFAQAGSGSADPSNVWFRDPPPAAESAAPNAAAAVVASSATRGLTPHGLPALGIDLIAGNNASPDRSRRAGADQPSYRVDQLPPMVENVEPGTVPARPLADFPQSGGSGGMDAVTDGDATLDAIFSEG